MKYCSDCTINHTIVTNINPNVVELIDTIIQREGYKGIFPFFNCKEVAINLDKAESIQAQNENRLPVRSMDFAICLKDNISKTEKMLLVELRLNYTNPNNLDKMELEEKVLGSSALLGTNQEIYKRYIFIFQSNLIQQAIRRFYRMDPRIGSNYAVYDLATLKAEYF